MKILLLAVLVLTSFISLSQERKTYYDYYWKVCDKENAYYVGLVKETDSGWLKRDYFALSNQIQMQALYKDRDCQVKHGYGWWYYANGNLQAHGKYQDNQEEGTYLRYHRNGMMLDSGFYHQGKPVGTYFRWHSNGIISDSVVRVNDSLQVLYHWFEEGEFSHAGRLLNEEQEGKWQYFHRNGKVAADLVFSKGKVTDEQYFEEDGTPHKNKKSANSEARYKKGGIQGWSNYLLDHIRWPAGLELLGITQVIVGVQFTVDENGKVIEAETIFPFHPEFDRMALEIIQNSGDWEPARHHNRRVRSYFVQPVTFAQQ